jgi:hypothetical protein
MVADVAVAVIVALELLWTLPVVSKEGIPLVAVYSATVIPTVPAPMIVTVQGPAATEDPVQMKAYGTPVIVDDLRVHTVVEQPVPEPTGLGVVKLLLSEPTTNREPEATFIPKA